MRIGIRGVGTTASTDGSRWSSFRAFGARPDVPHAEAKLMQPMQDRSGEGPVLSAVSLDGSWRLSGNQLQSMLCRGKTAIGMLTKFPFAAADLEVTYSQQLHLLEAQVTAMLPSLHTED